MLSQNKFFVNPDYYLPKSPMMSQTYCQDLNYHKVINGMIQSEVLSKEKTMFLTFMFETDL